MQTFLRIYMADELVKQLRIAAENGKEIEVISTSASNRGVPKIVKVHSVTPGGYKFFAEIKGTEIIKKFDVEYVKQITNCDGVVIKHDGIRHLSDHAKEWQKYKKDVVNEITNDSNIPYLEINTRFKIIEKNYTNINLYLIQNLNSGLMFVIHAKSIDSLYKILHIFTENRIEVFWEIFPELLKHEFYWPVWVRMLNDKVIEKDKEYENDDQDSKLLIEKYESFISNKFMPLPDFFSFAKEYKSTMGLSLYLKKSWHSQEIFEEHSGLENNSELNILISSGFVIKLPELTVDEIVNNMSINQFRSLIKELNLDLKSSKKSTFISYFMGHRSKDVDSKIKSIYGNRQRYKFVTPEGIIWLDLQNFRSNYRLMYDSLNSFLSGKRYIFTSPFYDKLI